MVIVYAHADKVKSQLVFFVPPLNLKVQNISLCSFSVACIIHVLHCYNRHKYCLPIKICGRRYYTGDSAQKFQIRKGTIKGISSGRFVLEFNILHIS